MSRIPMRLSAPSLFAIADAWLDLGNALREVDPDAPLDRLTGGMLAQGLSILFDQLARERQAEEGAAADLQAAPEGAPLQ